MGGSFEAVYRHHCPNPRAGSSSVSASTLTSNVTPLRRTSQRLQALDLKAQTSPNKNDDLSWGGKQVFPTRLPGHQENIQVSIRHTISFAQALL
eukprot:5245900-Amphidinium_carterae.1